MLTRPVTDRLIDSRIWFAVARGLHRLERWAARRRLAAWNAGGRAAVDSEAVGGLDVFAVRTPPQPTDPKARIILAFGRDARMAQAINRASARATERTD